MKTWWQRKTVTVNDVLLLAFVLLVVSVLVLWAKAGRTQTYYNCTGSVFDIPERNDPSCMPITHIESQGSRTLETEVVWNNQTVGIDMMKCGHEQPGDVLCYNEQTNRITTVCQQRMESAMRAMERYQEKEESWVTVSDATNTITWNTIQPYMPTCCDPDPMLYSPKPESPPPTLEQKIDALEQETAMKIRQMKKDAAEAEEARGRRIVNRAFRTWAFANWESVKKECWSREIIKERRR